MSAIVICESCDTKYWVSVDQIPDEGRKVRCANCGHVWFQATIFESDPEDDEDYDDENEELEAVQQVAESPDPRLKDVAATTAVPHRIAEKIINPASSIPKVEEVKMVGIAATRAEVTKDIGKQSVALWLKLATFINVVLCAAVGFGSIRGDIPDILEPIYNLVGVYDTSLLEFDGISAVYDEAGLLVINVSIVNNANVSRVIPMIRFKLLDSAGQVLSIDHVQHKKDDVIVQDGKYSFIKRLKVTSKKAANLVIDMGNRLEMMFV